MPLDSLGLGLTLDTTLLEKADKTLENMHKNSKLIMQNLTRGFTSFNSGGADALTKMYTALGHVSDALTKIDNAKVSPDFDTKGQEKYINRMQQLLDIVEKMSKIRGAKFYDPTEVYATDKDASDILAEIEELKEYKDELKELIDTVNNYGDVQSKLSKKAREQKEAISKQEEEVKKLAKTYKEAEAKFNSSMEALSKFRDEFFDSKRKKKPSLTDEEIQEMYSSSKSKTKSALLKQLEDERVAINEAMKSLDNAYKDLAKKREALSKTTTEYKENRDAKNNIERIKIEYNNLREREKILRAELKFAQATQAERAAMLTKKNEAEIKADQKRIRDVQKSYEQLRKEIQKGEKDIADLEASRQTLKEANRPTKGIDNEIKQRRNELNKLMQDELEFRSSQYWPKLQAIDEKFNSEAFIKNQKALAKLAAKESRKDVTSAFQYSRNAQTINEEKEAIKRLIEARDNLSTSTARYKKTVEDINKRILAHKDHIEAVTRVEKEQNTLADSVINRYRKQLKELDELNEALDKLAKKQQSTGALYTAEEAQARIDLTNRRDTVQKDILEIEKNAQGELDVIKEQHEAERAKKKVDSILKQNEKEKQEYAKLLDDLYALEKQKKAMEDAGAKSGDKAYDNILQQEQDLNNRISQLKAKHQNDLDEIDKKHAKKRNDDDVKAFIDAQKEKQRIAEETQKEIAKNNEKYGTISKRGAAAEIQTYKYAENIAQHKQAVEKLQIVRTKLDNTDKDYYQTLKKLNQEIHSHELFIRAAENESVRLGNSHRGLMDISGQLMRRLALVFSVSQITQYFRKLVEVRGQFEKTEVALTSIVGSQEKSNKLMNQTIALAIKSPFTLQQLTGYTKQLAAYQVAYEQLHDTTKMLADVSAGLGVEMDRLILAFGQVKAANYLRATEVRQFTEAGFNILGELAKYYTELEGTMVSVGDVQERVTKRMVDFADVEEIFHRVTEAGGMFYDMQSKQAETLAGQWTNLQDRIDVMLNEIGTDNENILKFFVKFLASAIDNWEVLASSIKTAAAAFLIFKTYSLLAGDGMKLLAIQMGVLTNSVPKVLSLGQAFKTLGKVVGSAVTKIGTAMSGLLTNPIFIAIAAIGALIGAGISLYRHFDKMKDALKEQSNSFNEYTSSLNKLSKEYNKLDMFTEKLAKLEELKSRLNERGLNLSVKIDEVNTDNIDKIFTENSEILQKSYDLGLSVGKSITRGINAAQGNIFGWSTFGENLAEDAEDFASKWNKLASYGMDAQMRAMENEIVANEKASEAALAIYETISEGRKAERDENGKIVKYLESEYEWTMRRAKALKEIQDLEDGSVTKNNRLARYIRQVTRQERELNHEVDNTINKLAKEFDGIENLMQAAKDNPVEFSAAIQAEVDKQSWDEVTKWVYSQKLHARLDITPNYVEDPNATADKVYKGFKKDLMDARSKLSKITDKNGQSLNYQNFFISTDEIDNMKAFSDGLEGIQKLYNENKKTIEQLDGTSSSYNKEELDRLNALQNALKEVAKKWGYDLDLNAKGGESEAFKKLKDQIKLIKEANKAYEERNKKFGKTDSQAVVTDAYKDAFKEVELAIEDIDYTNLEGVVAALESLETEAKKAGGDIELLKAISEVKAEIGLTLKERQDKELFNQVQELFDDYELAVDIKKLNLSPELAKNLFGVDTKSFDQMRTEIISKFAGTNEEVTKILSKGYEVSAKDEKILIEAIGEDRVDKAKEALEKIQDLEDKAQLERLKKYVEYAKKGVTERAKIKLEEMRQLEEIQKTFEAKDEGSVDVKAQKQDMANRASEKVRKETQDALNRLDWEEFEKSDMFIRVFDDLDSASTSLLSHLIEKIQGFKDEWTDMPLEDVEKIIDALNKLQTKLAEANPWKEFKKAKKDFEEAKKAVKFEDTEAKELSQKRGEGNYMAALDKEEIAQQNILDAANEQIAALEVQLATQEKIVATTEEEKAAKAEAIATTTKELDAQKGIKTAAEGNLKATQKVRSEHSRVKTSLAAQYQTTSKCLDMAVELGSAFEDLVGVLTKDDPAMVFAEMGLNMLTTVANTLALQAQLIAAKAEATGLAAAMNTAAGVIGWIVMAIQLLVTAISAAVNYAEKMRQMKLDVLAGQVDNLKQKFDALAESIDEAWSLKQLKEYEKELDKVQDKMKDAQKDYIKLLESGKDGDTIDLAKQAQEKLDQGFAVDDLSKKQRKALLSEEYQDYKDAVDALAEMEEDYADKKKEILESVGGITDPHDAASEFVDAWLDAYKETGDGLAGLEENFDEFFENLIKQKAARMLSDTLLTKWIDTINGALAEDSAGGRDLTESEMSDIKAAQEKAKGDINALLKGLFEGLDIGKEGGELSSLQKGIQGITEDTAQIIEAYLNSVRGYVSEQVTYTKRLYEMFDRMSRGTTYGLNVRMIS